MFAGFYQAFTNIKFNYLLTHVNIADTVSLIRAVFFGIPGFNFPSLEAALRQSDDDYLKVKVVKAEK